MALVVRFADSHDAARCVDALLAQADVHDRGKPLLARRYRAIADAIGTALDKSAAPQYEEQPPPACRAASLSRGRS